LNLPVQITVTGAAASGTIQYVYDATGVKLKKIAMGTSNGETEYAGNYIYENGNLAFFSQPEGYVEPKNSDNFSHGYDYIYQYKDHLGNIRLSYKNVGTSTVDLEIQEENNYYPFGLKHKGYNGIQSAERDHKFAYNGVEFEESLGYNMIEMGLRHFDPTIGRFTVMDPVIHHNYSPYQGFDNNPIFWADPSGADAESTKECPTCDEKGRKTRENGKYIFRDERGKTEEQNYNLNFESSSSSPEQNTLANTQCTTCPSKINLSQASNDVVESFISWARYIEANNNTAIYLSDMLKITSVTGGEKWWHMLFRFINEDAAIINPLSGEYNGNSIEIGYQSSYYTAPKNKFTQAAGVDTYYSQNWDNGQKRYTIQIHAIREGNNLPTMIYLHTFNEETRDLIREKINSVEDREFKPEGSRIKLDIQRVNN
jgi:RHS repeat-associated protein